MADNPTTRAGLVAVLAGGFDMVGTPGTLAEAWDLDADVLVAAGLAGDAADGPGGPAVLLLSEDPGAAAALRSLSVPAWGLVPPDALPGEIAAAVRALASGLVVVAPEILEPLLAGLPAGTARPARSADEGGLTPRELEVLSLVAEGLTNRQMAAALAISEHTVKFHMASIYAKLDSSNRVEAVQAGMRRGLISL